MGRHRLCQLRLLCETRHCESFCAALSLARAPNPLLNGAAATATAYTLVSPPSTLPFRAPATAVKDVCVMVSSSTLRRHMGELLSWIGRRRDHVPRWCLVRAGFIFCATSDLP